MPKTPEGYFIDWEAHAFGFGYGTGEPFIIPLLRQFMELMGPEESSYDYRFAEAGIGGSSTWFLINVLCKVDVIEYGTSPRHGWLTPHGRELKRFLLSKSSEVLVALACRGLPEHIHCMPDCCNCGPDGYVKGRVCPNPFWGERRFVR